MSPTLSPNTAFVITTIAGTGASSYGGDNGAATSASLFNPSGVALDSAGTKAIITQAVYILLFLSLLGNVYVTDTTNNRIRKVTVTTGIISTIAGTGASSYSGDGGAATSAELRGPAGIALDSSGS